LGQPLFSWWWTKLRTPLPSPVLQTVGTIASTTRPAQKTKASATPSKGGEPTIFTGTGNQVVTRTANTVLLLVPVELEGGVRVNVAGTASRCSCVAYISGGFMNRMGTCRVMLKAIDNNVIVNRKAACMSVGIFVTS